MRLQLCLLVVTVIELWSSQSIGVNGQLETCCNELKASVAQIQRDVTELKTGKRG